MKKVLQPRGQVTFRQELCDSFDHYFIFFFFFFLHLGNLVHVTQSCVLAINSVNMHNKWPFNLLEFPKETRFWNTKFIQPLYCNHTSSPALIKLSMAI